MSASGLAEAVELLVNNAKSIGKQFTVLGRYPGYLELAKKLSARVFDIKA